jgi:6-phosphogluconolactonase (cycloisomerase 2 family)
MNGYDLKITLESARPGAVLLGRLLGLLLGGAALAGCESDELFGDGPGAEASVTTPAGVQTGNVAVTYVLTSDEDTTSDVEVLYSTNGGETFREATEGTGGDGTRDLAADPAGVAHTFDWDSGADLETDRQSVVVRVRPDSGTSDETSPFTVNNGRFLAAVEDREDGRLWLYLLDAVDGSLDSLGAFTSGGRDPWDLLYLEGHFLTANESSNDVSVLALDEEAERLAPVAGSPFAGDGIGARYLASDGAHVFAANVVGGTISVFDFTESTGSLALSAHSGVAAPGCQELVARSSRLYVARQSAGEILVFDIAEDGELFVNGASPVTGGGLVSPRALVIFGTRLYAANFDTSTLCGFNIQGDGGLSAIAGSPFALSTAGIDDLVRRDEKLLAVNGAGAALVSLAVDDFGAVTEDAASPHALGGPAFAVAAAGDVVVAATTTSRTLEVFLVGPAGDLAPAPSSPTATAAGFVRIAVSE